MRIHSLELTNIASLRGNHKVDFNQINHFSSLFAITGKTGSGKSTILNCISLALYNDIYKKNSQSNDFITLGEDFGEIKLKFSTRSNLYLAKWHMRLKKKMVIYLKNRNYLEAYLR